MNVKGYLSTLIIILALFGINWEPASVPNQEIVVQFNDGEITFDQAQSTLAIVKKRLELIGVQDVRVVEVEEGRLKITYYSEVDVAAVKSILTEGAELAIGPISQNRDGEQPEFPSDNDPNNYELNVCEILDHTNFDIDFNGYLLEPTPDYDRYIYPVVYFSKGEIDASGAGRIQMVAYAVHNTIALHINNASYTIPEVRAGPLSKGIS